MIAQPPYVLAPLVFRFRALATLAGRLPLGGERELAMAVFVAARVVAGACDSPPLSSGTRRMRAAGARQWLSGITLTAGARPALGHLTECSAGEDHEAMAAALERVVAVASLVLDGPARNELRQLASLLRDT